MHDIFSEENSEPVLLVDIEKHFQSDQSKGNAS